MAQELASSALNAGAKFGFIACTIGVDVEALRRALVSALPGVPFVGVTSCRSVVGSGKLLNGPLAGSVLWLCGSDVKASVVGQAVSSPEESTGKALARAALSALGGKASFALFHGTPGIEEPLLRGLASELKSTPLLGGSAADDDISGKWSVFTHEARYPSGAALALVEWPGKVSATWVSGAMSTGFKGVVTRAHGRTIYEIDGKPAAVVYDTWVGGALGDSLTKGDVILGKTTLSPLGVKRTSGITLIHPERVVLPSKAIATFAEVKEGETVMLVKSTSVGMQGRPANLVGRALTESGITAASLKGVLLVYCAGCMLAIDAATTSMVQSVQGVSGSAPVVGAFHFGEQGCHAPGKPEHGNLMTGALLLG
jgi:hypothetical protein